MRPCLKCGTAASDAAVSCPSCGAVLPTAFGQTRVGHATPAATTPNTGPLPFKGTMMGMAPPVPAAPSPAARPAANLKGTMIGIAPPPDPTDLPPPTDPLGGPAPPLPGAQLPLGRKTMLGIARPGIAPTNPGVEKPRPEPPAPPPAAPWSPAALPVQAPFSPAAPAQASGRRPLRIPPAAAIAIVGAAALFTAAGVAIFLYRSRGAITASVTATSDGHEQLALICAGCSGESKVRLGSHESAFQGTHALLELSEPLPVGENRVAVELERRPGRSEQVTLAVPVDFRVRADLSGLAQVPPRVIVRVEAVPHSAVVVDGKALALVAGPSGTETAAADIDVSRSLTGMSSVVAMLERTVPYVVTPPSGTPASGQVAVRVGVTPLVVQAPGSSIVIEGATFVLAGHTAKDASVSVEGRAITVDGTGAFAQMMSVSAPGETNVIVRADAKDQAPRLVPVKVRRVQSLAAEAAAVRARATTSFSAIAETSDAQRGLAVALDGSVVEARAEAFTTVLLLDVKSGCTNAPCLARVSVGEKLDLKPSSAVSVFGTVTGAVEGPRSGSRIPAIAADFVVKGHP